MDEGVDIPLELERPSDPTVPEALRHERGDTTPVEQISREAGAHREYTALVVRYLELQETVAASSIPDDFRTELPQAVLEKIAELVPDFLQLSLYQSTTAAVVKMELEGLVRRRGLDEKIAELTGQIEASQARMTALKATKTAAVATPLVKGGLTPEDNVRVAQILTKMKADGTMRSMPVVGAAVHSEQDGASGTGTPNLFARVRRLFRS